MCHDCTLQKYPERILVDYLRLGIFAVCQKKRKSCPYCNVMWTCLRNLWLSL